MEGGWDVQGLPVMVVLFEAFLPAGCGRYDLGLGSFVKNCFRFGRGYATIVLYWGIWGISEFSFDSGIELIILGD